MVGRRVLTQVSLSLSLSLSLTLSLVLALSLTHTHTHTQQDVVTHEFPPASELGDSIGVGAYTVDIPGPVQIIVDPASGEVVTEGALKVRCGE